MNNNEALDVLKKVRACRFEDWEICNEKDCGDCEHYIRDARLCDALDVVIKAIEALDDHRETEDEDA